MKRVTSEQLAELAFQNPGSQIEVDKAAATQFLTLPNGRAYRAALPVDERAS